MSKAARPAAEAIGCPEYVYPWKSSIGISASSIIVSYISLDTTAAPIGIIPLVIALAHEIISGVTPKYSDAVAFPKRPKPVITSSKINKISCLSQISLNLFK